MRWRKARWPEVGSFQDSMTDLGYWALRKHSDGSCEVAFQKGYKGETRRFIFNTEAGGKEFAERYEEKHSK